MDKLKDVKSVSELLGIKPVTLYRRVRAGKISHRRDGKKVLRFSDSDIQSYLESIKVEKSEGKNEE